MSNPSNNKGRASEPTSPNSTPYASLQSWP